MRVAAEDLANTPAICRKSYVNGTVVTAFEDGMLERFSETLKECRSPRAASRCWPGHRCGSGVTRLLFGLSAVIPGAAKRAGRNAYSRTVIMIPGPSLARVPE